MMCQSPVELIANYSGHILIMEHADHRDSASLMTCPEEFLCISLWSLFGTHHLMGYV